MTRIDNKSIWREKNEERDSIWLMYVRVFQNLRDGIFNGNDARQSFSLSFLFYLVLNVKHYRSVKKEEEEYFDANKQT